MLNIVMADLLEGHPISEKKMKEVLGHTPLQVRVAFRRLADTILTTLQTSAAGRRRVMPCLYSSCVMLRERSDCCALPQIDVEMRLPERRLTLLIRPQVACGAILGVLVGIFYPTPLSAFPS